MRRPIEIREIRIDDLHDVFLLGRETIKQPDNRDSLLPWSQESLARVLSENMSHSFVAARKKAVEGFLIGRTDDSGSAEIVRIGAVGPEAAVVRANLYRAFTESLPPAVRSIRVAVPGSSAEMIDFFEKFGFTDSEHVVIMENFFRKNT